MLRGARITVALAIAPVVAFQTAGAQVECAPGSRISELSLQDNVFSPLMERRVSLEGRNLTLREALDRLARAARIRISYSVEQLTLDRRVCAEYRGATVRQVLTDLLTGARVRPVVVGEDQVVLAAAEALPFGAAGSGSDMMKRVGVLDRIVVTGSSAHSPARSSAIAMDVLGREQISGRGAGSLSGSLNGIVPGLWIWEQSPTALLARYGSIRGASSFGVSYPKVYVDGIEAANSLLVTHLDPDAISRIEVIRGPQGAALFGADAISGVMNIITRQDGAEGNLPRVELNSRGGASTSDYSPASVLAQSHGFSLRSGIGERTGRLGLTLSSIGAFVPSAFSQQLAASGGMRVVRSANVLTGTFRFFARNSRSPSSPVLVGLGLSRPTTADSSDIQSIRQFTAGITGTFTQNDRWTHTAVVGMDGYSLKGTGLLDGGLSSATDSAVRAATGTALRTTLKGSSVGNFGNIDGIAATVTLSAEHSLVRDETLTHRLEKEFAVPRPSLADVRSNAGLIGHINLGFAEKFYLSAGLRAERNTSIEGLGDIALLPVLGLTTTRAFGIATLKLRTAYGKGIRPAQNSSRAGTLTGRWGSFSGASLSPEVQSGIEAGADLSVGRFFSLHATRFDQRASGLIQPVRVFQVGPDSVPSRRRYLYELQNVGDVANRGWELQGNVGDGPWSIGASFTQVDSRAEKLSARYTGDLQPNDRMLEVPARALGVTASYARSRWSTMWNLSRASDWINYDRIAMARAAAGGSARAGELTGQALRSYWLNYNGVTRLGGKFGLLINRGMTLSIAGENLLDEQQGEPDNVTVLPGRTVSAGLKLSF